MLQSAAGAQGRWGDSQRYNLQAQVVTIQDGVADTLTGGQNEAGGSGQSWGGLLLATGP